MKTSATTISSPDPKQKSDYILEVSLRCLKIYIIPRIAYYPTASNIVDLPFTVYVPRNSTVGELQMKIALSLQAKSNKGNTDCIQDLCKWSRILKVDFSNESAEEINQ